MARSPKVTDELALTAAEPVTETITYLPGEGDHATVKWGGHTFQANIPKELTGHPDGTERERLNHQLIVAARDNRHFRVGNAPRRRDTKALPTNADEYRRYIVDWMNDGNIERTADLIGRFAKEGKLRDDCEVGSEDYSFIATLFMPKLHELAKADELTEGQVAQVWINHGVNALPW